MFDYLDYRNTIPLEQCLIGKVPTLNPLTSQYKSWWKAQKRKCVEGTWLEYQSQWRWMPGPLHFYVNFWHIEGKKQGSKVKGKRKIKPLLRDVEWIKFYVNAVIRGFSGFTDEKYVSCHRALADPLTAEENVRALSGAEEFKREHFYTPQGQLRRYVPALEYLYQTQACDYGKPLYHNQCLNLCDLEARGGGKSFTSAGLAAHNFLFDGATDYDEYLDAIKAGEPLSSQTIIGAIDTKYTKGLYDKYFYGIDNLEGAVAMNGRNYPSPLSKQYSGSPSGTLVQEYEVKAGGQWLTKGSKSKLHHRTFSNNPFAGNGTRPSYTVLDEIGFHYNLPECLGQLKECTMDGAQKDGSIHMCGTGGDMEGGSTEAVKGVFYDPAQYDCLAFDDIFEDTGKPIGFFFPAYMTLNDFKDALGNTDRAAAVAYLQREREKLKQGKSKKPYEDELQQRPLVPSEVFLLSEGNIFPALELKEHLAWLESSSDADILGQCGELITNGTGGIGWVPDLDHNLRACPYPIIRADEDTTGSVVIWEHPDADTPYGLYVGGCDPYAADPTAGSKATAMSLGSVFIIKRAMAGFGTLDKVVAEYTAKPESMRTFYENVRKLIIYYNGQLLFERNILGLKHHFENTRALAYLAFEPTILKANANSKNSRVYGQRTTKPVKDEMELMTREWLLEPAGEPDEAGNCRLNLHYLCSVPLVKELLAYNNHGNFDRTDAFMFAICQRNQMHHKIVQQKKEIQRDSFFARRFNGGN